LKQEYDSRRNNDDEGGEEERRISGSEWKGK